MRPLALLLAAALAALLSAPRAAAQDAAGPLNFLVILSDEMPPEYLGAYGGRYPTRHLDDLATSGLQFRRAYTTSPMCTPARFSLQTGRHAGRCQGERFRRDAGGPEDPHFVSWNTALEPHEPTLARALARRGYLTGLAGKWHLGLGGASPDDATRTLPPLPAGLPLDDPAMQEALAARQQAVREIVRAAGGFTHAASLVPGNFEGEAPLDHHNMPWITRGAVSLLRTFAGSGRPFLLFTTPTAVHGPWHADTLGKDLRHTPEGYLADVPDYAPDYAALARRVAPLSSGEQHKTVGMADLDHHVGVLLRELRTLGLEQRTVVVFLADHGIEPGKASVYDRGLRIPLLVRWPGLAEPGRETEALAQSLDVTATIAAACDLPAVFTAGLDGVDLRPVLRDPEAGRARTTVYVESGYARAVTDGRFKLVAVRFPASLVARAAAGEVAWLTHMGAGAGMHAAFSQLAYPDYFDPDQLYALETDPWELRNRHADPALAGARDRLRGELQAVAATMEHPFPASADPFLYSAAYRAIAARTRAENNPHERNAWVRRDHDAIPWPPAATP